MILSKRVIANPNFDDFKLIRFFLFIINFRLVNIINNNKSKTTIITTTTNASN